MCGIVGYVGSRQAMPILMQGLAQLEYRGYDSTGIALQRKGKLDVFKRCGRLSSLRSILPKRSSSTVGIGHTRWATHGVPNDLNAHPHFDSNRQVAVVHNGIVENARELRGYLVQKGCEFTSETDSEVLAVLIADIYQQDCEKSAQSVDGAKEAEKEEGATRTRTVKRKKSVKQDLPTARSTSFVEAVRKALLRVVGTYGILVVHRDLPGEVIVGRNGSPVILGIGDREMFVASDAGAVAPYTRQVVYLEDGEIARITTGDYEIQDLQANVTLRDVATIDVEATLASRGEHEHFTLKEIYEQPEALLRVMRGRIDSRFNTARFGGLNIEPRELLGFNRIKILGCGSAYISAKIGAAMIERLARIPADAESAAEFRYRNPIIEPDTLYFAVSQSGETYDTLAAVQEIQRKGGTSERGLSMWSAAVLLDSVALAYTCMLVPKWPSFRPRLFPTTIIVFALFALHLGRMRDLSPGEGGRIVAALEKLPGPSRAGAGTYQRVSDTGKKIFTVPTCLLYWAM